MKSLDVQILLLRELKKKNPKIHAGLDSKGGLYYVPEDGAKFCYYVQPEDVMLKFDRSDERFVNVAAPLEEAYEKYIKWNSTMEPLKLVDHVLSTACGVADVYDAGEYKVYIDRSAVLGKFYDKEELQLVSAYDLGPVFVFECGIFKGMIMPMKGNDVL